MVDTFLDFWPPDVPLTVYAENVVVDSHDGLVTIKDLHSDAHGLIQFKSKYHCNKQANGIRPDGVQDYRFDAVRFANKVFAIAAAAENSDADVLWWLDADLVFHAPVTHEFLDEMLSDDAGISYLSRDMMYSECGLVGYRISDPNVRLFLRLFRNLYTEDHIFEMAEWHDSFAFDELRRNFDAQGLVRFACMSGDLGRKTSHPLINGPWGVVADHAKGPRKAAGRSRHNERMVIDGTPYWDDPATTQALN